MGLDAVLPAFFLSLLLEGEVRGRRAVVAAVLGALIALVLLPRTAAGVPIVAASLAALVGLWRARA